MDKYPSVKELFSEKDVEPTNSTNSINTLSDYNKDFSGEILLDKAQTPEEFFNKMNL